MLVRLLGNQAGMSLIEIMISLALLGMVGVGLTVGLSTANLAVARVQERNRGVHLAESQLELIKASPLISTALDVEVPGPYPTPAQVPPGYLVTNTTRTLITSTLQVVTATVSFEGQTVFELTGLKTAVMP